MICSLPERQTWWQRFTDKHRSPIWRLFFGPRIGKFDKFVFPVIKNMEYNKNTIEEIMAVQPMNGPSTQVFYLDFVYKEPKRKKWYQFWKKEYELCTTHKH